MQTFSFDCLLSVSTDIVLIVRGWLESTDIVLIVGGWLVSTDIVLIIRGWFCQKH